jgi:hypothetical protein
VALLGGRTDHGGQIRARGRRQQIASFQILQSQNLSVRLPPSHGLSVMNTKDSREPTQIGIDHRSTPLLQVRIPEKTVAEPRREMIEKRLDSLE